MKNLQENYIKPLALIIRSASFHFDIWWVYKEKNSRSKYLEVLREYPQFFNNSLEAHFLAMVVELYKLFETRKDTVNFPTLIGVIRQDKLLDKKLLGEVESSLTALKPIWVKITVLRSELFAHTALAGLYQKGFQKANVTPKHIKDLIEGAKKLLNLISDGVDRNTYSFEQQATTATVRILDGLNKHIRQSG